VKKKTNRHCQTIRIEEGSGNVFRDLEVKDPDEALVKAKLAIVIATLIRNLGLTQSAAAARLGVDQPKVSLVLRGRLREFSVERLLRFISALEQDITITVRPRARNSTSRSVLVEMAA
jgi:predicted XRE-type DNA-binding protein